MMVYTLERSSGSHLILSSYSYSFWSKYPVGERFVSGKCGHLLRPRRVRAPVYLKRRRIDTLMGVLGSCAALTSRLYKLREERPGRAESPSGRHSATELPWR